MYNLEKKTQSQQQQQQQQKHTNKQKDKPRKEKGGTSCFTLMSLQVNAAASLEAANNAHCANQPLLAYKYKCKHI